METLCISECVISTSALVQHAAKMKDLHSLKRFKLNDNYFTDETASDIAKLIASSAELERLWLHGNEAGDGNITKMMKTFLNQIISLR